MHWEELKDEGSLLSDTPSESDARDKAKVPNVLTGDSQKMSKVDDDDMNEQIRETLKNK